MYVLHRCKQISLRRLTIAQVMESSRNAEDVSLPRKSASTRRVDAFEGPLSRNLLAMISNGFLYLLEVRSPPSLTSTSLTPDPVQFLDESSEVRSQYTDDGSCPFGSHDNSPRPASPRSGRSPDHALSPRFPVATPTDGFTVLSLLNSESPGQPQSRNNPLRSQDNHSQLGKFQPTESSTFVYQQPPGQPILWPLEHEQEAMLLQHYIENVALFVSNTPRLKLTHLPTQIV
jgi:hypothetical protein